MALFDAYIVVDWSAASRPRHGKDSIWWALVRRINGEVGMNAGVALAPYVAGHRRRLGRRAR